jgi:hypothetical protein
VSKAAAKPTQTSASLQIAVDLSPVADQVDDDYLFHAQNLVNDTIIAHAKLVESGQLAGQALWLEVIQVLCQPPDSTDNPSSYRSIQPAQLSNSRFLDSNLVHVLVEPKVSNHILQATALLPGKYPLSLTQKPFFHLASDLSTFVWVSQDFEQLAFDRGFYYGLQHFSKLLLGHFSDRVSSHACPSFNNRATRMHTAPLSPSIAQLGCPDKRLVLDKSGKTRKSRCQAPADT